MAAAETFSVVQAQLEALDDTDCYASVWNDILSQQRERASKSNLWGGRGKGGRGLSRRTVQPYDVVVEDVRLQYLRGDVCLEGATLNLLQGHKYALCGRNGCGKSTLLQRMHAQKIPGWSAQWSSLYLPPELPSEYLDQSPMQVLERYQAELFQYNRVATEAKIDQVQAKLDQLDMDQDETEVMERLCEELSELEEQLHPDQIAMEQAARTILKEMECDDTLSTCRDLSPGQQKRILLSVAMLLGGETNLLLMDEPTSHLDVFGLIQLRRVLEACPVTVVMTSHDVDFLNDVATDIIEMQDQKLWYFPGNYDNFRIMKEQQGIHELRQSAALEKKRGHILTTLQHIKEQPIPKRGGTKKKAKAVSSQRKKLERHTQLEKALSSSSTSSIIPVRRGLTAQQRLKLAEVMKHVPHKAVQFNFPEIKSTWGEPLITALEVGFGYGVDSIKRDDLTTLEEQLLGEDFRVVKKDGYIFDCVDLCVDEGSRHCICGPSASGKSTLLQVLAMHIAPLEGTVYHASGIRVGYFDGSAIQETISTMVSSTSTSALEYLVSNYPEKTEQELRGHLTAFGLSPTTQAKTPVLFLSSGEKCRFLLAATMIENPPVLCMDDPTLHLDVESVQALVYGLREWNGTLVLVSSDATFLRSLGNVRCSVLVPEEGKLRRVDGGIDAYLKSFQ